MIVRTLHRLVHEQWKRSGAIDVPGLRRLLEEGGHAASGPGLDPTRAAELVDQLIRSGVHRCGAGSPEVADFVGRHERELALLREASPAEREAFWLKKSCWLAIQAELDERLLLREETRLRNANVTAEWLQVFGDVYLQVAQAQAECRRLERRLALAREDPSLSEEELERRAREEVADELAAVEELRRDALHAAALARDAGDVGGLLSGEQLERYRAEARTLVRQIWRLTHPDALDPAFTDRQRERLRELLERAVAIRREEALLDVRALSVLRDVLRRVTELYELMGVDVEPGSVIRGDTLAQRTAWLEGEIGRIEAQLRDLMAEVHAMAADADVREKRASMADAESRRATRAGLARLAQEAAARLADLEGEHAHILRRRAPGREAG